ncbi:MAG: hypothetical protein H0V72_30915 [Bradyrhizobium sp.]|nr:hypothetical protein [Bradyrhizobium sp.]
MQVQPAKTTSEMTEDELDKVSAGAFKGPVTFGAVNGESTDKDHKDWVYVMKYDHA